MLLRRDFLAAAAGAAFPLLDARAAAWPTRPVQVIVPFSAGGASDVLTRILCARLQEKLGQTFSVDNRTGAGGNIGMDFVKVAPADGYTVASATIGTLSINQFLFTRMSYDAAKDFAYVSTIWENCNVFVVSANHPAKTLQEFLAWAQAQPGGVTFGSAGVGTTPHLAGELFRVRTGIKALHIPYRGAAQSIPALVGGDTNFAIDNIASYTPLIRSGKVRALAVTSPERWPSFPEVPTMSEAGVKDFLINSWGAFVVPKNTPKEAIDTLSAAIRALATDPAMQQHFLETGAKAISSTPAAAAAYAEQERAKWKEIVRISGAKLD